MENIFKRLSYKDYAFIMMLILSIFFAVSFHLVENERQEQEAKMVMIEQEVAEAEAKANKKSDIELLEQNAYWNANGVKDILLEIEEYKSEIKRLEGVYEFRLLTQRCYESQIDRKINGLEYNLNYCEEESNLDQFRTKKY